jgi:hypothetical protein
MPNAKVTSAPPLLGVAVTVAELPAESVDAVALIVGVTPVAPGAAAADAETLTTAFLVTAAEIVSPLVATTDGPLLPLTVTVTLTATSP